MARIAWHGRIVANPKVMHGEVCVKGTRIPVVTVLDCLAAGMSATEIIEEYPSLTGEDIAAALSYASDVVRDEPILPLEAGHAGKSG